MEKNTDRMKSINESMRCSMENNLQQILEEVEHVIDSMKMGNEKYKQHQTTFYWLGVRMSNSKRWRDCDIEVVEQLHSFSESMTVYTDQIVQLAEDILVDVQKLKQVGRCEEKHWNRDVCVLSKKTDILHLFSKEYVELQTKYLEYILIVNEMLNQHKHPDVKIGNKIKKFILGRE